MTINIRRGLFRLWIVCSAVFVIVVCLISYGNIRDEFKAAHTDYDAIAKEIGGDSLLPADCSKARGIEGTDYSVTENLCWYKTDDFRRLYPEYKDLNDKALSEKLYEKAGHPLRQFSSLGERWKSGGGRARRSAHRASDRLVAGVGTFWVSFGLSRRPKSGWRFKIQSATGQSGRTFHI